MIILTRYKANKSKAKHHYFGGGQEDGPVHSEFCLSKDKTFFHSYKWPQEALPPPLGIGYMSGFNMSHTEGMS